MSLNYDYLIIGGGLAGLQLAFEFGNDRFFEQKTFAIIDPSVKDENDKTWCFWEQGDGKWDEIIYKSWQRGLFFSSEKNIELRLSPYSYKMLRSLDFYNFVKARLKNCSNISFIKDEIETIDEASCIAYGKSNSYSALHIFDSRLSPSYLNDTTYSTIFQHFKGWTIKTKDPFFDPETFTMMDYRLKYKGSTSFTYVLPFSKTEALIEYTFFTPFLTEEAIYDKQLKIYLQDILKLKDYTITETEKGIIPMTDYPFHKDSTSKITKIGTAGSWVKGSSGYSFKHTEKKVAQIISNIKRGLNPGDELTSKKFRWFDSIFLDVLYRNNEMGEDIFTKLYSKNSPQQIFKFLDEETTLSEDMKVMLSLYHPQFIKSFFRKTF